MNGPEEPSLPLEEHVRLLTYALAILEEEDLHTKRPEPIVLRAAAQLDAFLETVNAPGGSAYPPGFIAHIRRLRTHLGVDDPRAARKELRQACKDLEKFMTFVRTRHEKRMRGVVSHATAINVGRYLGTLFRELSLDQIVEARQLLAEEVVRVELYEAPPLLARHVYAATERARGHLSCPGSPKPQAARAEIERVLTLWNAVARP